MVSACGIGWWFSVLGWWPWCWTCWTCADVPQWPAQGQPTAAWVRQAIEWRMKVGLNDCPEVLPALDAWTLDWLSRSDVIRVNVETKDWPFLASAPELQSVVVQRLALDQLRFKPTTQLGIVQDVRAVARRSHVWDDALRRAFDNAEGLAKRRDKLAKP
jgi:hypothetical protein